MLVLQPNFEPIPGYRIINRLGRGGCGEVWKAEAPGGVFKAIKFVFGNVDGVARDNHASEQEQKSLERVKNIRHPFILSTERFEIVEDQLVIVMELADGSLGDRFDECKAQGLTGIPRDELLRYMEEAAEALDLMNSQHQIQHMDIKPQNIFLVHQHVKLGDFGLAKNLEGTRAALTGGMTPTYAPPESFDGWVSRQSDQYSLAIVYQEMLTGKRPFHGNNSRQLIMQHLTAHPDLSPLSPSDRVPVDRALAKLPEKRFGSCLEFVRALRATNDNPAAVAKASGFSPRPARSNEWQRPVAPVAVPPARRRARPAESSPRTSGSTASLPRQTHASRGGAGVLFPTLIVGVGAAGLAIIQSYRKLLLDRYQSPTLPHVRWLYLDSDPESLEAAISGNSEIRLSPEEVLYTAPPEADSVRRGPHGSDTFVASDTLNTPLHLSTGRWARGLQTSPEEHALPALIELANSALKEATSMESLAAATRTTRLDVRSRSPRIYLAGSLAEELGSMVLVDLAYALKNELRKLGYNPDYLIGLQSLPDLDDEEGLHSCHAVLDDLSYFDRPNTQYKASTGSPTETVADRGRPFGRFVAFQGQEAIASAANLLRMEMLSPAGQILQSVRSSKAGHHYSAFGIRRVLWPRDHVVRGASQRLARETLAFWSNPDPSGVSEQSGQAVNQCWLDRRLDVALVRTAIEYGASQRLGHPVESLVQDILQPLAGTGRDAPTPMMGEVVLNQLAELLGDSGERGTGRIAKALEARALEIASDVDLKLAPMVASLLERPGQRIAAARTAILLLESRLKQESSALETEITGLTQEVQAAYDATREALDYQAAAGKHASRRQTVSPEFVNRATHWAQTRIRELRDKAASMVYWRLLAAIPEFLREVETLADRLEALTHSLDSPLDVSLQGDGVCEYLFPFEAESLDEATARLADAIGESGQREFDDAVQSRLRAAGKGILQLVVRPEWGSRLSQFLITEAERFMEMRTNRTSVSQALLKHFSSPTELHSYLENLLHLTNPGWVHDDHVATFVGLPDDPAGQSIGDLFRKLSGSSPLSCFYTPDEIAIGRLSVGVSLDEIRSRLESEITAAMPSDLLADLMPSSGG